MKTQRDLIDKIKNKLDLLDIMRETVDLNKKGSNLYTGSIGKIGGSGESLKVDGNINVWKDFKNGKGGDVLDWIGYVNGLDARGSDFPEVLRIAAEKADVTLPDTTPEEIEKAKEKAEVQDLLTQAAGIYHRNLKPEHYIFIKEKWGITPETVDKLKIGYATPGQDLEDLDIRTLKKSGLVYVNNGMIGGEVFRGRLIFPYWKAGKVVYFIGRETEETPENEKNRGMKYRKQPVHKENYPYISEAVDNSYFYGEDSIRGKNYCILTEGVTDCINMLQAGLPCISPVTVQFREKDYPKLLKLTRKLKTVYICNDNEENEVGLKGALKTAEAMEIEGVETRIIQLPRSKNESKVDLSDFMKSHSLDNFKELMVNSMRLWDFKLNRCKCDNLGTLDRKRAADSFILDELNGMNPDELKTFVMSDVKDWFKLNKQDLKSSLDLILSTKNSGEEKSIIDNGYDIYPYILKNDGLYIENEKDGEKIVTKISSTPVTVNAVGVNLDTDTSLYKIAFFDNRKTKKETWKEPADLLTRTGVIKLIDDGLLFNEEDCKYFYRYFKKVISNNSMSMDMEYVASKNGWKKGNTIFIMGEKAFTEDHETKNVLSYNNDSSENYTKKGTLAGWIEGVKPLLGYDIARFQCYAAASALILKPLGVGSFIVDNFAESGTGKTVRCYAAMSMLGNPLELKINANSTNVGLEKTAEFNTDLPLFIDETSDNKYFKDFVYMLSNGKGKTRGTKEGGLKQGGSWETVVLTTGERPILNDKAFSGQQVRVLEIHETIDDYIPETIKAVEEAVKNNYGHIIELYIEKVFDNSEDLKTMYSVNYENLQKTKSNLGERSKAFFAAIATAGELLESVFCDIGIEKKDGFEICKRYFDKLIVQNPTEHYSIRALETAYQWAIRNYAFFYNTLDDENDIRHEIYGWITKDYLDFDPDKLKEYLDRQDIDYTRVVQDWRDMGISVVKKGRLKFQATHDGKKVQVIRVPIKKIVETLKLSEEDKENIKYGKTSETTTKKNETNKPKPVKKIVKSIDELEKSVGIEEKIVVSEEEALKILSGDGY
ncbi:MAG: DUF927 domain-containing protein [Aliarcobacter sp.]